MSFDAGQGQEMINLVAGMLEQHFDETADGDPDLGIYLNPDDAPGVESVCGFPIERHKHVDRGMALLFDRKRLSEWRFSK